MFTPRPYQDRGITDIFSEWTNHDILMFILATGGGKTVTFMEIARQFLMKNRRVMVVAHREELIMNTWKTLYESRIYAGIIKSGHPENFDLRCQVGSIQTMARRKKLPPADLIIIDEAHHVQDDNTYGRLLALYPNAKVLMVTATPYRLSGDGFLNVVPGKETKLIVNSTLGDLTAGGWLVPIRYYISSMPDLTNVSLASNGDYKEEEAEKAMAMAPLVESYLKHCKGMTGIIFAVNVHHSLDICRQYDDAYVNIKHLDANTNSFDRNKIINQLRNKEIDGISNVGILTEGADFPNIGFAQLGRPTMSLSLVQQMVGRVTRALGGVVDGWNTDEERHQAIANSDKPYAIVLDNAGCWKQHGLPDDDHQWERHFRGEYKKRRKAKMEEEEMEMIVFVAEDEAGVRHRTKNPKEIEGMVLIEVTKEIRKKVVNIVSIKEFERLVAVYTRLPKVQKVGILALKGYIDYCKKYNILIVQDIWDHLYNKLVTKRKEQVQIYKNILEEQTPLPASMHKVSEQKLMEAILKTNNLGVPESYFEKLKKEYILRNTQEYMANLYQKDSENKVANTIDFNN